LLETKSTVNQTIKEAVFPIISEDITIYYSWGGKDGNKDFVLHYLANAFCVSISSC
jgi:hypothetical protein